MPRARYWKNWSPRRRCRCKRHARGLPSLAGAIPRRRGPGGPARPRNLGWRREGRGRHRARRRRLEGLAVRATVPEGIRITKVGLWYVLLTVLVGAAATNTGNNALYLVLAAMLALL